MNTRYNFFENNDLDLKRILDDFKINKAINRKKLIYKNHKL